MKTAKFLLVVVAVVCVIALVIANLEAVIGLKRVSYSEFVSKVSGNEVERASWQSESIVATLRTGQKVSVVVPLIGTGPGADLLRRLEVKGVDVEFQTQPAYQKWLPIVSMVFIPIVFVVLFYLVFIKPSQNYLPKSVIEQHNTEDRLRAAKLLLDNGQISLEEHDRLRERILSGA